MIEFKDGKKFEQFGSINEFYSAICDRPINEVFRWETLSSSSSKDSKWRGTNSFEEASNLLKNGWETKAEKLTQLLKLATNSIDVKSKIKNEYSVAGFQACVPRYIQGNPMSMINQKKVTQKQKVITLNKSICYASIIEPEQIEKESIMLFQVIQKIESQGIRTNLNLVSGTSAYLNGSREKIIVKIRIKNAGERLNISKLAFPLVHPSMLRRLIFRYIETCPHLESKGFISGYGTPMENKEIGYDGEVTLPIHIKNIDEALKQILG